MCFNLIKAITHTRMYALHDRIFSLFGKKSLGQVVGAAVIGAMAFGFQFIVDHKRPPVGELTTWTLVGAAAGLTAGLMLLSPRIFFGAFFGLLGILISIVPMSKADGTPVTIGEHAIKVGIGTAFMVVGIVLMRRKLHQARDRNCKQGRASNGHLPSAH